LVYQINGGNIIQKNKKKPKNHISQSDERLDLCLSAGNLAWWEMDVKTGKVIFNENKVKMLGYNLKDFENVDYTAFTNILHPDDHEKAMKAMSDHLMGDKKLYQVEYRIKTKNGDYKWFYDKGSVVEKNNKGEPLTVKGIVYDITSEKEAKIELNKINENLEKLVDKRTKQLESINGKLKDEIIERKKAEEYSNRTRQNLRNIIDSAGEAIISFDMNNRISIWNKTIEKITGYQQIEVVNRSVGKLEVFNNPENVIEKIKHICSKKPPIFIDIIFRTKENYRRVLRVNGTEIKSSNNECIGVLFIGKDITEEIELHRKLLRGNSYLIADKNNLSSIDLLFNLASDDFNGLFITRGNLDQIKRQISTLKNIDIALLSGTDVEESERITNLEILKEKIDYFTAKNKKSVILLDGVHYLISRFSFNNYINFLYDLNDIISKNKAILFVRIDPSIIDTKQMAIIENELLILPNQKTDDLIIEDNMYNILMYINDQNQDNAVVSVKKVMQKFNITYVTTATRIDSLEKKKLLFTKKQGKIRAIFISEKGKQLLQRRKIN